MSSTVVAEKTEEELRKEIDELHRQQREVCKYANIYVENHDFLLFNLRLIVPKLRFLPFLRLQSGFAIPGEFAAEVHRALDLAILPPMAVVSVALFDL